MYEEIVFRFCGQKLRFQQEIKFKGRVLEMNADRKPLLTRVTSDTFIVLQTIFMNLFLNFISRI